MVFDLEMIKGVYTRIAERIETARKVTGKPLTLTEKILYSHLFDQEPLEGHLWIIEEERVRIRP